MPAQDDGPAVLRALARLIDSPVPSGARSPVGGRHDRPDPLDFLSIPASTPPEARVRIALRWSDIDMLGHLNEAVYHSFLEEARGALIAPAGGGDGFPFVLARVELDYRREVRHRDGHVDAVARVAAVGRRSVTIEHEILLPDGTPAATGRSVIVAWDAAARGSRELTPEERTILGAGVGP